MIYVANVFQYLVSEKTKEGSISFSRMIIDSIGLESLQNFEIK